MKKLSISLSNRFYKMCENIKNSQNYNDLNFHLGVACGFSSALMLSDVIDFDCYVAMREYIDTVHSIWYSSNSNKVGGLLNE